MKGFSIGRLPWGFLGMLGLALAVELWVARHHLDLAPEYSAEWLKTNREARRQARRNEIFCFGDSLVKVGVAPRVLEARLEKHAYNLALSGGQPIASYYMLRHALEAGGRPTAVLVDSKWSALAHQYTLNEPILPDILGPRDILDLAWTARDGRLAGSLFLAKVLPSYRVRFEARADVRTALRGGTPPPRRSIGTWRRNWERNRGAHHVTRPANTAIGVDPNNKLLLPDAWSPNPVVATYLERFFALAESRGIPVFWLVLPSVPEIQARHETNRIDRAFTEYAQAVQQRFPNLVVIDGRSARYPERVFLDPTHLARDGAAAFTDDVATVLKRQLAGAGPSPRWETLPAYRDRPIGVALEDIDTSARIIAARGQNARR